VSRTHSITGHGGVNLFVRDHGPEDAPVLLLVHGWSQSSLSWSKQINSGLTKSFRIIAPDLRGHGQSDKPEGDALYQSSEIWAEDINAIITDLDLKQPLLAGWSMGAWIVGDYLRHMGDATLSGVALIGGAVTSGSFAPKAGIEIRRPDVIATGAYHKDSAIQIPAIIDFLKACTPAPMSKRDLAFMTGFNMQCPPDIRKACRFRSEDYRPDHAKNTKPTLLIHGAADRVITLPMHQEAVAAIPGATTHLYSNIGHAPFWEDAARFNADLAQFTTLLSSNIPAGGSDPAQAESRLT